MFYVQKFYVRFLLPIKRPSGRLCPKSELGLPKTAKGSSKPILKASKTRKGAKTAENKFRSGTKQNGKAWVSASPGNGKKNTRKIGKKAPNPLFMNFSDFRQFLSYFPGEAETHFFLFLSSSGPEA